MFDQLRRIDRTVGRIESALATVIMMAMVVAAAVQVLLYNVATRGDVAWAHALLSQVDWIDVLLTRGTLVLAFLGASLAAQQNRHIGIDALNRILPAAVQRWVRGGVGMVTGLVCVALAVVFWQAANGAQTRPLDLDVLTGAGSVHICDAPSADLTERARPWALCTLRSLASAVGASVESFPGIALFVVPFAFMVMALRFFARAVAWLTGGLDPAPVPHGGNGTKPEASP